MFFLLNGKKVKTPSVMGVTVSDIDAESERNAKGRMVRNKIRHIHGLQISYNEIKPEECAEITSVLNDSSFIVDFYCPLCAKEHHIECYSGDRQINVYSDKLKIYTEFSFDLIEM